MERLWSPWRSRYVTEGGGQGGCIFCRAVAGDDDPPEVVYRSAGAFVIMNAFPYNSGHVMVAPDDHVGDLGDLDARLRTSLFEVVSATVEAVRTAFSPDGFNVGMNLGAAAGAGVPNHLHVHVVPRWEGDTNFMPVLGETKVLPETLEQTAAKLRPAFRAPSD